MCVPNQAEDLNLRVFNIITGINESKILTKHVSCKCKCKFHGRQCNSNKKLYNNKCRREGNPKEKNPIEHNVCEKDYI